ncbi:PepSY domain-containing protein [Paracoccus onubensis]|uniref:Peptidase n=1 Tax=Paracoccus onubensis TaxID=1675788 RepID=A0A418T8F4_9RHOB|nr:PepSY domain-containing protein [Paracoccus onubensis]RJE89457.1 peptidase [Paracoccus onubensis]
MSRHRIILLCLLFLLPAVAAAQGLPSIQMEDGLDAGEARAAVLRGEILSLDRILDILRKDFPGEIVEIQLELEDGILIYEFDILSPDGRLNEIEIEAATGRVLEVEEEDNE